MKQKSIFLTLGFFLCFWVQIEAQTSATVIRVVDGDTYQMLKGKRTFTVRLLNVDAPETPSVPPSDVEPAPTVRVFVPVTEVAPLRETVPVPVPNVPVPVCEIFPVYVLFPATV